MPGRSKGKGQMKCTHWSSMLGLGRRVKGPTSEKSTVMMRLRHMVVAPMKKETNAIHILILIFVKIIFIHEVPTSKMQFHFAEKTGNFILFKNLTGFYSENRTEEINISW
jgi:hypothetical protein